MCAVKRWPLRGGLTTAIIAYCPLLYQALSDPDPSAYGYAFFVIPLLGISYLMFSIGLIYNVLRLYRKWQRTQQ